MKHNADNLTVKLAQTEQGERITVEPQYIEYLRSHGYTIKSVDELHTVESESKDGVGYVVVKITTYAYPKGHEKLDLVAHEIQIPVCDCWSFRQNSNDVAEQGTQPGGSCKHTRDVFREQRAKEDKSQTELTKL
jgi:hypothetical protein